jgi:hypothetical protein
MMGRLIGNGFERILKETTMALFEILYRYLLGRTEEKHETPQS